MTRNLFFLFFLLLNCTTQACEVSLSKTEIINSEFYIDFTIAVEKILTRHGYTIVPNEATTTFESQNYITTGTTYFRLQQANVKFELKTAKSTLSVQGLSNCITVSCPVKNYVKALKQALEKLDTQIADCKK